MSLNEFLGDNTLGSWADEMDALPTAPSLKTDEDRSSRPGDRFSRRDDFGPSRPDRQFAPPREDLPFPTQPPFTAFVGNLAFDITESELENCFSPHKSKSVKIIKDRDDKPKGFGYIEFADPDALKDALSRTGFNLSGRTIRVSVAEPRFGGLMVEEDTKFSGSWRRDGPLPSLGDSRESSRRRFDGPPGERAPPPPSASDGANDWRSSRPVAKLPESEAPGRRRGPGPSTPEGQISAADREDHWSMGSRFKASPEEPVHGKLGSVRGKFDSAHIRDGLDEGDWRARRAPGGTSPSSSTPPTPQMSRKKLELLPRSSTSSTSPSPLSSPKLASNPSASKANPFGAAKPVDVSSKEREVTSRLEKEREIPKDRGPQPSMSRTSSSQATERGPVHATRAPPSTSPSTSGSPTSSAASANIRPSFSFANAAGAKSGAAKGDDQKESKGDSTVDCITDHVAEIFV
ncbi:hypothetical protein PAXRUDRAFT_26003 [Paxillus rubicundulus Ve08.2h10]|uniref:RRM domain-containing protein n=1 Tax=Paxillus rubicundulus Ve08.2h10 TaxID=930991 RepID=A0A0D0E7P5_9AGAM|nr:hypothetical protein PAXRUDRAFT_26003 [Paxillus rubicundulus Ve08.2h10]